MLQCSSGISPWLCLVRRRTVCSWLAILFHHSAQSTALQGICNFLWIQLGDTHLTTQRMSQNALFCWHSNNVQSFEETFSLLREYFAVVRMMHSGTFKTRFKELLLLTRSTESHRKKLSHERHVAHRQKITLKHNIRTALDF